jgi:hypothetical protein
LTAILFDFSSFLSFENIEPAEKSGPNGLHAMFDFSSFLSFENIEPAEKSGPNGLHAMWKSPVVFSSCPKRLLKKRVPVSSRGFQLFPRHKLDISSPAFSSKRRISLYEDLQLKTQEKRFRIILYRTTFSHNQAGATVL